MRLSIALTIPMLVLTGCSERVSTVMSSDSVRRAGPIAATSGVPVFCTDPRGDTNGSLDLVGAAVNVGGPTVAYEWIGAIPTSGSVLWSTTLYRADGTRVRQLGYKIVDGKASSFVIDETEGASTKAASSVTRTDDRIELRFPDSALEGVRTEWTTWSATLKLNGADIDSCTV